jgi:hypothetical protein
MPGTARNTMRLFDYRARIFNSERLRIEWEQGADQHALPQRIQCSWPTPLIRSKSSTQINLDDPSLPLRYPHHFQILPSLL